MKELTQSIGRTFLRLPKGYSAAVLHAHTNHSDGLVSPRELVIQASRADVKVLAITDHDTMSGVSEARRAAEELGIEVVAGQEIQTSMPRGLHVVGLFLKKAVVHSKPVDWTVKNIQNQGGIAVVAHPMSRIFNLVGTPTGVFQLGDLDKFLKFLSFDAIEVRHPGLRTRDEARLDSFYLQNQEKLGARLGVSDSHFGQKDLFGDLTIYPGKGAGDLYRAIAGKKTLPYNGWRHPVSRVETLVQAKKALVDLGYARYSQMARRWARFDFSARYEGLG